MERTATAINTANNKTVPYILIIITTFFWGSNIIAGKLMNGNIPPFALTFYRWLIVAIILFPLTIKNLIANIEIIKKHLLILCTLGLIGIAINTSLIYLALEFTSALNGALISATNPLFIVLAAFIFLKETISLKKFWGLTISMLGVVLIITQGNWHHLLNLSFNFGDLILLIAVIMWAFYSILLKYVPSAIGPLLLLFITTIFAEIFLLPAMLIEYSLGQAIHINALTISGLFYLAICPAIIGYISWDIGIKKLGNATCGVLFNLSPFFSSVMAIFFLKEPFHSFHLVGFSLILVGVFLNLEINFTKK